VLHYYVLHYYVLHYYALQVGATKPAFMQAVLVVTRDLLQTLYCSVLYYTIMYCSVLHYSILQVGAIEPAFMQAVLTSAPLWLAEAGPATVAQVRGRPLHKCIAEMCLLVMARDAANAPWLLVYCIWAGSCMHTIVHALGQICQHYVSYIQMQLMSAPSWLAQAGPATVAQVGGYWRTCGHAAASIHACFQSLNPVTPVAEASIAMNSN
jgi:hypothetical protein